MVNKYLHTSLMASFRVCDPQLVPSNTTQDKKVKQNTFSYMLIKDSSFSQKPDKKSQYSRTNSRFWQRLFSFSINFLEIVKNSKI